MTWQHLLRSLMVVGAATAAIALAAGARAEGGDATLVPIDEVYSAAPAELDAEAQIEEQAATEAKPSRKAASDRPRKASKASKAPAQAAAASAAPAAPAQAAGSIGAEAAAPPEQASIEVPAEAEAPESAADAAPPARGSRRASFEAKDQARAALLRALVERHASEAGIPFELADAVIRVESRYSAGARNGPNVGLTQINTRTAQSLGYQGAPAGLLDPETNLRYGLKYLARAYELAKGDTCGTILRYQAGLRTQTMTRAARSYCARVKTITASAQ